MGRAAICGNGDAEGNHGALILNTVDFEAGGFTVGEQQSFIHIFQTVSIGFRLGEERDFFRRNSHAVIHDGKVDHIVHPVDGEEQFAFPERSVQKRCTQPDDQPRVFKSNRTLKNNPAAYNTK